MAKVKVVNTNLDENINLENFTNVPSETIFNFGSFTVTSNFDGRTEIDYSTRLSSFVNPISISGLTLTETQSEILYNKSLNTVLNLDKSDLNTYVKFGSAYEYLRVSFENIITNYPGSLLISSQVVGGGNITFYDFSYDSIYDTSTFKIPTEYAINTFGLVFDYGNTAEPDKNVVKNLNISYDKYIIWSKLHSESNGHTILAFTGDSSTVSYIMVTVDGNPFSFNSGHTSGYFDIHIKPNNKVFEEYRTQLSDYEQYIIAQRENYNGFRFILKDPTLLDNGKINYANNSLLWSTSDGYNLDINTPSYQKILNIVLTIGAKYDNIKTDLILRFLTPDSIKTYDLTDEGKMTKLLRIYGQEFDVLKQFIDSLTHINTLSYDKIKNIPDQLVSNLARTLGWQYFNLVNEEELVSGFLSIDDTERNLETDLLPSEVNIELWRRILMNTNYFWKSKGTRESIKSIFLLIGIPEPFINITEYVYTVDGKIDIRKVELTKDDFPSNSLPYDNSGYPVVPVETTDFYFQMSGDTDSGQAYMNNFRLAGFNLLQTIDNKKSWIQTGATTRIDVNTPQYYQEDSKLVLNTKEVDVALDIARGIEYDVWRYVKFTDFPANSSGYTLPYTYVNLSLSYGAPSANTFTLPFTLDGDFEVRYNGILLNAPKTGSTTGITAQADYTVSGNQFTITNPARIVSGERDVIQVTYLYSGGTTPPISGITIQYLVTRVSANSTGTIVQLPAAPNGDIQLTINGIALTKGTGQFNADYIIDSNDSTKIVIQNQEVIAYLAAYPQVQVAYITVTGNTSLEARNEIYRIDSFTTGKLSFNSSANKYVFRLNYKLTNTSDIKVLIDGIALEPQKDYIINPSNRYEIYLPRGLKYGTVISVYYIVGGSDYFDPIVSNDFGIGDISQLSFLEFIELVQRRMINATNRKIITDYKGGWYPTLLKLYTSYLQRSELSEDDPLHSWGYTFENLYSFLSKYNAFFQKFVDQLLSSTIIQRKGGLLIRNTIFSKQKFTYKRGVYMGIQNSRDVIGNVTYIPDTQLYYLGDDDSIFEKRPLIRTLAWTNDFILTGDFCTNFKISDVTISYPVATTTTTAFPYQGILQLNTEELQQTITGPLEGLYYRTIIAFIFNPVILPNYNVNINLNLVTRHIVDDGTDGGNNNSGNAFTRFVIEKNGMVLYDKQYFDNYDTGAAGRTYTEQPSISVTNGDFIEIRIENQVIQDSLPSTSEYDVSARSSMTPEITSVTPNGEIIDTIPLQITREIAIDET